MHVVLRADARPDTGVGHVVRSLALAERVLAVGGTAELWGEVSADLARELVDAAGLPVLPAPEGLLAAARAGGGDVLHVDDYAIDADLRGDGVAISSTEDGAFGRRPADVVIDATPGAEQQERPDDGSARLLRGVRFAPLRRSVLAVRDVQPAPPEDGSVLVVMGGTDPFGASAPAAALARAAGARRVVVLGGPHVADALRAAGVDAEVRPPVRDLPALATGFDVVVSAAGTSVFELACVGVATALVPVARNQEAGYAQVVGAGAAVGLGSLDGLAVARLHTLLADAALRSEVRAAGRAMVDGRGAARVVDAWADLARVPFVARPAEPSDARALRAWRNDPLTRAASRSTDEVTPEEHAAWLHRVLDDPARLLLVVERGTEPLGSVRFDREDDGTWEVSIALAPHARGRGLGAGVLAAAESTWRRRAGGGTVVAGVRPDNVASRRLFEAAGFREAPPGPDGLARFVRT